MCVVAFDLGRGDLEWPIRRRYGLTGSRFGHVEGKTILVFDLEGVREPEIAEEFSIEVEGDFR